MLKLVKTKPIFIVFGVLMLVTILAITPSASGQVRLGNMGLSSVGKLPIMTMVTGTVSDGSVKVSITTASPTIGQSMLVQLNFKNSNGNPIQHENYNIIAMQDGNTVLSNSTGHTYTGQDTLATSVLTSSDPVVIQVTLNGIGLLGTDPTSWTGAKDVRITFNVVPEFGQVAPIVLMIAIISVIIVSSKTRGFLKL